MTVYCRVARGTESRALTQLRSTHCTVQAPLRGPFNQTNRKTMRPSRRSLRLVQIRLAPLSPRIRPGSGQRWVLQTRSRLYGPTDLLKITRSSTQVHRGPATTPRLRGSITPTALSISKLNEPAAMVAEQPESCRSAIGHNWHSPWAGSRPTWPFEVKSCSRKRTCAGHCEPGKTGVASVRREHPFHCSWLFLNPIDTLRDDPLYRCPGTMGNNNHDRAAIHGVEEPDQGWNGMGDQLPPPHSAKMPAASKAGRSSTNSEPRTRPEHRNSLTR